jgi:uncharacterized protein YdhG (YjbR/CyaY superfamily)
MSEQRFTSVDDYIASFPEDVQAILQRVRATIRDALPDAGETISYHMPTVTVGAEPLFYYAGWKRHISIYPAPISDDRIEQLLAPYRSDKSTLKFPISDTIPYELIRRVAELHLEQWSAGRSHT